MKKYLFALLGVLFFIPALAQDNTVTVVASGDGQTKSEAEVNALRSAVEQAYGVFVSANTNVLNDEITRDEVATISSGNIKSYKELSSAVLSDGTHSVMLQVVVSPDHLISYAKAKCGVVEVDGGMFAIKRKMRELNKINELNALKNLAEFARNIGPDVYDTELSFSDYAEFKDGGKTMYKLPLSIGIKPNKAAEEYFNIIYTTLEAISISDNELESYRANNAYFCRYVVGDPLLYSNLRKWYSFRNSRSVVREYLLKIFFAPMFSKKIRLELAGNATKEYVWKFKGRYISDDNKYAELCAINTQNCDDVSTCLLFHPYGSPLNRHKILLRCSSYSEGGGYGPGLVSVPGFFLLQPFKTRNSICKEIQQFITAPNYHLREFKDNRLGIPWGAAGFSPDNLRIDSSRLSTTLDLVMEIKVDILVDEATLDSIRSIGVSPYKLPQCEINSFFR